MVEHEHEWKFAGRYKMGGEVVYECPCGTTAYREDSHTDHSRLVVEHNRYSDVLGSDA